jgi:hypothetical protein
MKKADYIKDKEMGKEIKLYLHFLILIVLFGCIKKNEDKILDNTYKGFGIFFYHEIDSGNLYEMKFIPFHVNKTDEISLKIIEKESKNLIFERGISFNSFRKDILDQIFINSKSCGDI